jgi:hypothetical protein
MANSDVADERISILTAYMVGLEGVLARLVEIEAKAVFMTASDFAAGLIRIIQDAIQSGALPAAQRTNSKAIQKNFRDGWPSVSIPAALDLIIWRGAFVNWLMKHEDRLSAHFRRTPVAAQFEHHLAALYDGLGVVERHRGETRRIYGAKDQRARAATQKFTFDFNMK